MNIRFLETAVWLAHYRNFRLTGERLHLTQPAISSRIQQIEQELGFRIFERQGREVTLTPKGEAFVADAQEVVRRYETLMSRHRPAKNLDGLVRMGLASSMAHLLLPDIIQQLREQHPDVRLEVFTGDTNDKLAMLADGSIDICLMANHFNVKDHLKIQPLCSLDMVWVASPSLVSSSNYTYTAADLSMLPIITYAAGTLNASRTNAFFGAHMHDIRQLMTSNSLGTSIHMAIRGIGAAVLPAALVQSELAAGSLVMLKTSPIFPPTDYAAVWLQSSRNPNTEAVAYLASESAGRLMAQFSSDLVRVV
ncbi:LysR family transcriptional regulator [Pusillimonas sp. TS35]|uniref:LysR family transcriptional regulator n=1 Tax=Paracandidimonas lactea TaxID=2895524 RepID=UPI00136DB57C|nr:LysR family transcriptional regulator [Paracandidimonas lactea]MYN13934.1 LysR family transcriptional regulator [Pusillimonas sp. TS35]